MFYVVALLLPISLSNTKTSYEKVYTLAFYFNSAKIWFNYVLFKIWLEIIKIQVTLHLH